MPTTEALTMSPAGARAAQKLDALRQTQAQAEHRVKLGTQLLKAAEAHTQHTRSHVEEVRQEQNELREQLEKDVAAALHQYDQWVGTIDENLTRRLEKIERRLEQIESHWTEMDSRVMKLVKRSEALMEKSQAILEVVADFEDDEDAIIEAKADVSEAVTTVPVPAPAPAPKPVTEATAPAAPTVRPPKVDLYTRLIRDMNEE